MRKYITEKKNTLSLLFICVGLVFCGWVGNNWRFKTHEDREEIAVRSAEWYAIGGNVIYTNSGLSTAAPVIFQESAYFICSFVCTMLSQDSKLHVIYEDKCWITSSACLCGNTFLCDDWPVHLVCSVCILFSANDMQSQARHVLCCPLQWASLWLLQG